MNDGTTAYAQEYAIMYNNDLLVSVGASITSGTCGAMDSTDGTKLLHIE